MGNCVSHDRLEPSPPHQTKLITQTNGSAPSSESHTHPTREKPSDTLDPVAQHARFSALDLNFKHYQFIVLGPSETGKSTFVRQLRVALHCVEQSRQYLEGIKGIQSNSPGSLSSTSSNCGSSLGDHTPTAESCAQSATTAAASSTNHSGSDLFQTSNLPQPQSAKVTPPSANLQTWLSSNADTYGTFSQDEIDLACHVGRANLLHAMQVLCKVAILRGCAFQTVELKPLAETVIAQRLPYTTAEIVACDIPIAPSWIDSKIISALAGWLEHAEESTDGVDPRRWFQSQPLRCRTATLSTTRLVVDLFQKRIVRLAEWAALYRTLVLRRVYNRLNELLPDFQACLEDVRAGISLIKKNLGSNDANSKPSPHPPSTLDKTLDTAGSGSSRTYVPGSPKFASPSPHSDKPYALGSGAQLSGIRPSTPPNPAFAMNLESPHPQLAPRTYSYLSRTLTTSSSVSASPRGDNHKALKQQRTHNIAMEWLCKEYLAFESAVHRMNEQVQRQLHCGNAPTSRTAVDYGGLSRLFLELLGPFTCDPLQYSQKGLIPSSVPTLSSALHPSLVQGVGGGAQIDSGVGPSEVIAYTRALLQMANAAASNALSTYTSPAQRISSVLSPHLAASVPIIPPAAVVAFLSTAQPKLLPESLMQSYLAMIKTQLSGSRMTPIPSKATTKKLTPSSESQVIDPPVSPSLRRALIATLDANVATSWSPCDDLDFALVVPNASQANGTQGADRTHAEFDSSAHFSTKSSFSTGSLSTSSRDSRRDLAASTFTRFGETATDSGGTRLNSNFPAQSEYHFTSAGDRTASDLVTTGNLTEIPTGHVLATPKSRAHHQRNPSSPLSGLPSMYASTPFVANRSVTKANAFARTDPALIDPMTSPYLHQTLSPAQFVSDASTDASSPNSPITGVIPAMGNQEQLQSPSKVSSSQVTSQDIYAPYKGLVPTILFPQHESRGAVEPMMAVHPVPAPAPEPSIVLSASASLQSRTLSRFQNPLWSTGDFDVTLSDNCDENMDEISHSDNRRFEEGSNASTPDSRAKPSNRLLFSPEDRDNADTSVVQFELMAPRNPNESSLGGEENTHSDNVDGHVPRSAGSSARRLNRPNYTLRSFGDDMNMEFGIGNHVSALVSHPDGYGNDDGQSVYADDDEAQSVSLGARRNLATESGYQPAAVVMAPVNATGDDPEPTDETSIAAGQDIEFDFYEDDEEDYDLELESEYGREESMLACDCHLSYREDAPMTPSTRSTSLHHLRKDSRMSGKLSRTPSRVPSRAPSRAPSRGPSRPPSPSTSRTVTRNRESVSLVQCADDNSKQNAGVAIMDEQVIAPDVLGQPIVVDLGPNLEVHVAEHSHQRQSRSRRSRRRRMHLPGCRYYISNPTLEDHRGIPESSGQNEISDSGLHPLKGVARRKQGKRRNVRRSMSALRKRKLVPKSGAADEPGVSKPQDTLAQVPMEENDAELTLEPERDMRVEAVRILVARATAHTQAKLMRPPYLQASTSMLPPFDGPTLIIPDGEDQGSSTAATPARGATPLFPDMGMHQHQSSLTSLAQASKDGVDRDEMELSHASFGDEDFDEDEDLGYEDNESLDKPTSLVQVGSHGNSKESHSDEAGDMLAPLTTFSRTFTSSSYLVGSSSHAQLDVSFDSASNVDSRPPSSLLTESPSSLAVRQAALSVQQATNAFAGRPRSPTTSLVPSPSGSSSAASSPDFGTSPQSFASAYLRALGLDYQKANQRSGRKSPSIGSSAEAAVQVSPPPLPPEVTCAALTTLWHDPEIRSIYERRHELRRAALRLLLEARGALLRRLARKPFNLLGTNLDFTNPTAMNSAIHGDYAAAASTFGLPSYEAPRSQGRFRALANNEGKFALFGIMWTLDADSEEYDRICTTTAAHSSQAMHMDADFVDPRREDKPTSLDIPTIIRALTVVETRLATIHALATLPDNLSALMKRASAYMGGWSSNRAAFCAHCRVNTQDPSPNFGSKGGYQGHESSPTGPRPSSGPHDASMVKPFAPSTSPFRLSDQDVVAVRRGSPHTLFIKVNYNSENVHALGDALQTGSRGDDHYASPSAGPHQTDGYYDSTLEIYEVGGGRKGDRPSWLPILLFPQAFQSLYRTAYHRRNLRPPVSVIFFVASLPDMFRPLLDVPGLNRMTDTLNLFSALLELTWLENVQIVLVLNKLDVFQALLQPSRGAYSHESDKGSSYLTRKGRRRASFKARSTRTAMTTAQAQPKVNLDAAVAAVRDLFLAKVQDPNRRIIVHVVNSLDRNHVLSAFATTLKVLESK